MRQGKFLFVILSLIGVQNVLGQFSTITTYGTTKSTNVTDASANVGIGTIFSSTNLSYAKLHAVGSSTTPAAIFSSGNVGVGGLSTSFASGSLPTNLLHLRDGNMWVQRGALRISAVNATDDALWVSNGRANLTGGVYVGYSGPGTESFMQYIPSVGSFEIKTNSSILNTYDFKIGSIVNNVNLASPVFSTNTNMLFQINSGLSATAYNFKFLNGNTQLATLFNDGTFSLYGDIIGNESLGV